MKKKYFVCLLAALVLLVALAVPALAEPEEAVTAAEQLTATAEEQTVAPGDSTEPGLEEDPTEAPVLIFATVPETTAGIVPIDGEVPAAGQEGLLSQRNLTFYALGLGGLALLLSVIALARTRKKTAPNATGNYQKYF
ncbi:MAG: hypothetical protein FWC27_13930 [Firmicutes bacterium]|nr:hypothetical protein [Bacillota bacterium]